LLLEDKIRKVEANMHVLYTTFLFFSSSNPDIYVVYTCKNKFLLKLKLKLIKQGIKATYSSM